MKIVSICAALAAGAILLWAPFTLVTGTIIAALVVLSLLGGIKTMMGTLYAAPSIAAVAIVVVICGTIITLTNIAATAPVRISQEQLDREKATALATGKALVAIDLSNATGRAVAAERERQAQATRADAAEAKVAALKAQPPKIVSRVEYVDRPAPVAAVTYATPPQWRQYVDSHLLIGGGGYTTASVRADCSRPSEVRAVEWSRDGSHWDSLKGVTYQHVVVQLGSRACVGG